MKMYFSYMTLKLNIFSNNLQIMLCGKIKIKQQWGSSWSWSYGSWIYNYLCNQCLSPLKLLVQTHSWQDVLDTTLC